MPGEFEPHSSIWLGWPRFQWFTDTRLDTRQTIAEILQTLSFYRINSNILCTDEQGISAARDWMRQHGWPVTPYMNFLAIPQIDIWIRDFGPVFLKNRRTDRLAIASFAQNQWGYSDTADDVSAGMAQVPESIAGFLGIDTVLRTGVVSEGGGRVHNGEGTLLVNRSLELRRNPGKTVMELETVYKTMLGATSIIWLNDGLYEDLQSDSGPVPYRDAGGSDSLLVWSPDNGRSSG